MNTFYPVKGPCDITILINCGSKYIYYYFSVKIPEKRDLLIYKCVNADIG